MLTRLAVGVENDFKRGVSKMESNDENNAAENEIHSYLICHTIRTPASRLRVVSR